MLSRRELCADVITPRVVRCSPPVESLPSLSLHAPAHLVSSLPATALPPPYRCGHAIHQISEVVGCGTPPPASENSVAAENASSAAEASASPLLLRKGKIPVASLQRAPVGSYWTAFLGCRRVHWRAGRRKVLLLGIEKFRPFRWAHQAKQSVRLCHLS